MRARRARALAILVGLPIVAAALLWAATTTIQRPSDREVQDVTPSLVTEEVQRRVLESAVIARGDVVETDAFTVTLNGDVGGLEGEPVYTGRVAREGSRVGHGAVLAEISGRPVILLEGPVPMYRRLTVGTVGSDVEQLERGLSRLGFLGAPVDRVFDRSTALAVQALYQELGYDPTRVVPDGEDVALEPTETTRPAEPALPVIAVPRGEVVFVPGLPRRIAKASVTVGQVPGGAAFTLRGTEAAVVANVPHDRASLVRKGARVELFDAVSGVDTAGRVASIGRRADQHGNVPIRITAHGSLRRVVGVNVRVRIPVASSGGLVLAVSPAAIYTAEDGRTYVELVRTGRDGSDESTRLQVRLGLVADSLVEIKPVNAKLEPGDRLVVSAR